MQPAVTIRDIGPDEDPAALLLGHMGWEIVKVGEVEHLLPTDPEHPDYAKCKRDIDKARAAL